MTKKELKAIAILNETPRGDWSTKDKIKKLGEEVMELGWGVAKKNNPNILEEIGDCALLLLHILQDYTDEYSLQDLAIATASKIKERKTS